MERFDQIDRSHDERTSLFEAYFALFPRYMLRGCRRPAQAAVRALGSARPGGRPPDCIDPSNAIVVAARISDVFQRQFIVRPSRIAARRRVDGFKYSLGVPSRTGHGAGNFVCAEM
jgi:hypothetical protein